MSIIFCGDFVIPYGVEVDYSDIVKLFDNKIGVVNLEGAILPNKFETKNYRWSDKFSLYSSPKVFDVFSDLNIKYASLCNNHILDYNYPIENTVNSLLRHDIRSWGLRNHDIIEIELNNKKLYVITFATYANEHSLNLFSPKKIISEIRRIKKLDPNSYIAVYPHWGVEKFPYPEPADRKFAHKCIDAGADLIVGHHPHIIQPVEYYKNKPIIYSLGNFILPQTYYSDKKLNFKDPAILQELVLEWDGESIIFYALIFNKVENKLMIDDRFSINKLYTLFDNCMSDSQYLRFYLSKARLVDIIFRTRYFDSQTGEYISYLFRNTFRAIRKVIMKIGLHKPF